MPFRCTADTSHRAICLLFDTGRMITSGDFPEIAEIGSKRTRFLSFRQNEHLSKFNRLGRFTGRFGSVRS